MHLCVEVIGRILDKHVRQFIYSDLGYSKTFLIVELKLLHCNEKTFIQILMTLHSTYSEISFF